MIGASAVPEIFKRAAHLGVETAATHEDLLRRIDRQIEADLDRLGRRRIGGGVDLGLARRRQVDLLDGDLLDIDRQLVGNADLRLHDPAPCRRVRGRC